MRINSFVALGATAFAVSGILNIFADFMPDAVTRSFNFIGVCLGILGLQALYVFSHQKTGTGALAGMTVATFGFLGIAGFLFADAFVFPFLDPLVVETLTAGTTGLAIFAAVVLYVLGVILFSTTLYMAKALPRPALMLWAIGTLPTIAAIALPPFVMTIAEIVASIGVIWISVAMLAGLRSGDVLP